MGWGVGSVSLPSSSFRARAWPLVHLCPQEWGPKQTEVRGSLENSGCTPAAQTPQAVRTPGQATPRQPPTCVSLRGGKSFGARVGVAEGSWFLRVQSRDGGRAQSCACKEPARGRAFAPRAQGWGKYRLGATGCRRPGGAVGGALGAAGTGDPRRAAERRESWGCGALGRDRVPSAGPAAASSRWGSWGRGGAGSEVPARRGRDLLRGAPC